MANAINNNMFLVNAPAGSGKTTFIKDKINEIVSNDKDCKILCITYTNRAADELISKINSKNVKISTIHSFISEFFKIYFSNKDIIELYFETYKGDILDRINNISNDERNEIANQKYKEEHEGNLSFEYLKNNTKSISYNELPFNSLYYGGLSHDALLSFAEILLDKYPIIKKRLSSLYKYIFIDEYQDTSANILRFFYNAVKDSQTTLFLCGDKMQQIYKNYDGTFENELSTFNNSDFLLRTNYRSSQSIVTVLNNIYNEPSFVQKVSSIQKQGNKPQIYIAEDVNSTLNAIEDITPKILKLFIYNKDRFEKIGAKNLYEKVSDMEKYSFGSKNSPVDVLLTNDIDNPDPLFRLLFEINDFLKKYKLKQYGLLVQKINNKKSKIYNKELLKINKHEDKKNFQNLIESIYSKYNEDILIIDFLKFLNDKQFLLNSVTENYFEDSEENEYLTVLEQSIEEFRKLCEYIENPKISTQHGVKGEGHDEVVFIAEDSTRNPYVRMYDFFELLAKNEVRYNEFEKFYYEYVKDIRNFEYLNNIKLSELKKDTYNQYVNSLNELLQSLNQKYNNNVYYNFFFSDAYASYLSRPGVTKFNNAVKINNIFGTLIAYKLFYVGCSRAKEILKVIVERSKIDSFYNEFKTKMQQLGFDIIE
ncbi:TPA: DNA helicase II [Candidatus Gastranaerophilales bacterium HUM_23]|nr:MAG TPA: DNA helicase II [Candidatus Gastranaerophilales bacterium HUM_17]DAB24735.1 MAG TPA: DNA helicase II [Candidatus Gastranaerophilales bacterium HUM_23]